MGNIIYFDVSSDFGFFKKPDINKIYLTYNFPPKPAILGMIGSILGLSGLNKQYEGTRMLKDMEKYIMSRNTKSEYLTECIDLLKNRLESLDFDKGKQLLELLQELKNSKNFGEIKKLKDNIKNIIAELKSDLEYPEYYKRLEHLKVGIKPIGNFPFNKIVNDYNNHITYSKDRVNLIISEQLLIEPKYRIFIYDDDEKILNELFLRISNNNPIFMPYFGKNEFIVTFNNLKFTNNVKILENISTSKIYSVFLKSKNPQSSKNKDDFNDDVSQGSRSVTGLPRGFLFLEQYPVGYLDGGLQYDLQEIELTERDVGNSEIDLKKGILLNINNETIYLI